MKNLLPLFLRFQTFILFFLIKLILSLSIEELRLKGEDC